MQGALHVDLRRLDAQRPPAFLLGGINLARALGLGGIPVIVGSSQPSSDAFASRYCVGRCILPAPQDAEAALEALMHAGERLAAAVGRAIPLFYGDDTWLAFIQEHRDRLARCFRFALSDPEVAAALIDKARFQEFAARRGLPVPRTLSWEALETFDTPVLVKPQRKADASRSPLHLRLFGLAKARVYVDGWTLAADPLAAELREELTVQEYVRGDDRQLWSFHGFADDGELLAWFIGRKLRTWPALTGESSYLELAHHPALAPLGRDITLKLPLKGVFKMDFKQDQESGEFRLLEINARYNLWHYLGAANGLNLAGIAYEFLVNGARPSFDAQSPRYRTRVRWLAPGRDYHARRQLGLSLFGWLASLVIAPKVYDLFSWSDPVPFVRRLAQRVGSHVRRLLGRAPDGSGRLRGV